MSPEEREAFDAMRDALYSINEVDDNGWGDGTATVCIDYVKVEAALALADKVSVR
jgi:hypothetical protein